MNRVVALRIATIVLVVLALLAGGRLRWQLIERYGVRNKEALGLDGYYYYVSAAEALLEGRGLDPAYNHRQPPPPLYIPPPLQSVFIALVYKLCGRQELLDVYRAQALLSLAAGWLAFAILRRWAGALAALTGLWIWMLYPEFVYWARLPMTESNYLFLMLLTLWALTRWAQRPGAFRALAGAALIGLGNLQRASALALGPVMALAACLWLRDRRARWIQAAIFFALPHLVLAPWMIRNWVRTGDPVWVNSNGGILLYAANHFTFDPIRYPEYLKYPSELWLLPHVQQRFASHEFDGRRTYYRLSRLYMAETRKYILAHPLHFLKNYSIKLVQRFVLMPNVGETIGMVYPGLGPGAFRAMFYGLLLAGLAGLIAGRRSWRSPTRRGLALCFACYAGFIALMHWDGDGRLTLPLRVFLALFAAVALSRLAHQARSLVGYAWGFSQPAPWREDAPTATPGEREGPAEPLQEPAIKTRNTGDEAVAAPSVGG